MRRRCRWDTVNAARRKRAPGTPNKTEARRLAELELLVRAGEIRRVAYHGITLLLAPGARYTPDVYLVLADGRPVCEEVKGSAGWNLDSEGRTKFMMAVSVFTEFVFRLAIWDPKQRCFGVVHVAGHGMKAGPGGGA